ncbi:MAG TPA: hypothetical protein VFJ82_04390 [Longimicrobium sp.]|nr:hypothetical protein [Longimicrobium sp.]
MKKLRLDLDSVTVDSFATGTAAHYGGTVRAHDATEGCTNKCTGQTYDDTLCGLTWGCSNVPSVC